MSQFTLEEMKERVLRVHQGQRKQLAEAYLESLNWGVLGLANLGHRLEFGFKAPQVPQEFPKMLYRHQEVAIATSLLEEEQMNSEGFWSRPNAPVPSEEPPASPQAPIVSIKL